MAQWFAGRTAGPFGTDAVELDTQTDRLNL